MVRFARPTGYLCLLVLGLAPACDSSADAVVSEDDGTEAATPTAPPSGSGGAGGAATRDAGKADGAPAGTAGRSGGAGGATSTGGGGSGTGGSTGSGGALPHVVSPCPTGQIGVWENVTPPGSMTHQYGSQAVVVNPQDPATVYLGTDFAGLYQSTDCGATWAKIATGRNGDTPYDSVSAGENWSIAIDPVDPNVLYSVAGYGSQGLWKTTNGGTDWDQLFLPQSEVAQSVDGNFASIVSMDPHDHLHLVVAFHNNCKGAYADHCQAETKDGGATWRLLKVPGGGEGSGPIVIDATTWIFGSYDGLWRTSDSGATWNIVFGEHYHHYLMHTDAKGNYYVGCSGGVITSSGDASVWKIIPNSGYNLQGITGDGKSIFVSQQFSPGKYFSASEADPMSWKEIPNDGGSWGAYYMAADRDHHIIYGSEMGDGLWRMVTY